MTATLRSGALDRLVAGAEGRSVHVAIGATVIEVLAGPDDPRLDVVRRGLRAPGANQPVHPAAGTTRTARVHVGAVDDDELRRWSSIGGDGAVRCIVDARSGLLGVWDTERRIGFWGVRTAGSPSWDVGAPMRPILAWILEHEGALVHASTVAGRAGAVLIAGPGGSGKSTTALHAVLHGYGTLGDDYCLVDTDRLVVERIFSTAKVHDAERPALESIVGAAFGRCEPPDDRTIHSLPHPVDRAPLVAVVLPRLDGLRDGMLRPAARGLALRLLAPSSIAQLPVAAGPMLTRITAMLRGLPAHVLDLAPDRSSNVAALASLVGEP